MNPLATTPRAGPAPGGLLAPLRQGLHAARWRALARRFDQRNQRERVLMIGVAAAVVLMLADRLWLSPALNNFHAAQVTQDDASSALRGLHTDTRALREKTRSEGSQQQAELTVWRARVRAGDQQLRDHQNTLVGPDHMVALLAQLLARHGEVKVRAMRSLGRSDVLASTPAGDATSPSPGDSGAAASAKALSKTGSNAADKSTNTATNTTTTAAVATSPENLPSSAPTPTLYRHGVELELEGGFSDLLSYLRTVEALPQRVLWGSVSLKVEQHPRSVLTLRVYTLSRDAHWLEL